MSADNREDTIKLWDGVIEIEAPVLDADTQAFKAALGALIAKFCGHGEVLLSPLRDAYDRGPKAQPFDADKASTDIAALAYLYYARERVKREAMSAADREARCRAIADALRTARNKIEEAMTNPDLANDLTWAWWEGTSEYVDTAGQSVDLLYIEREFEKVVKGLAALQAGAIRAAGDAHKGRGRPRGTSVLPQSYIIALAGLYRDHTGLQPGAGEGPFARFVCAFLAALGRNYIAETTVIDAIKDARARALANPSKWGPSPFDD